MRIIAISDTHCQHELLTPWFLKNLLSDDLVIHAGDGSNVRHTKTNQEEMEDCLTWLNNLGVDVIYVPGNHDTSIEAGLIEPTNYKNVSILIHESMEYCYDDNCIKIFGSPFTPTFGQGWAYNKGRHKLQKYWNQIPDDTDVVVTHGPVMGFGDLTENYATGFYEQVGCKSLLNRLEEINPGYHICGHIHDEKNVSNYGVKSRDLVSTKFVNASIVNLQYKVVNTPIIIGGSE